MPLRVAVVGAGCSGLAAIKICLEEGLNPVCFESSCDVGGLWRFTTDRTEDRGCVLSSTVINTSKEMMAFSDFPPPQSFPNFMPHYKVVEYFRLYERRFGLRRYIEFNSEVVSVTPHADHGMVAAKTVTGKKDNAKIPCFVNGQANGEGAKFFRGKGVVSDLMKDKDVRHEAVELNGIGGSLECNGLHNTSLKCHGVVSESVRSNGTERVSDKPNRGSGCSVRSTNDVNNESVSSNDVGHATDGDVSCRRNDNNMKFITADGKTCFRKISNGEIKSNKTYWEVKVRNVLNGEVSVNIFDRVMICTGHHAQCNMPTFPGQSQFKGRIIHSRDVKKVSDVTGTRHVVVGVGNSGCDVAVELSHYGQVFLSTRRGTWLWKRLQDGGLPTDVIFLNRFVMSTIYKLPSCLLNALAEWELNKKLNHSLYRLRPKHRPTAAHATVNDELPNRIAAGTVTIKANIQTLTPTGIIFGDGSEEKGKISITVIDIDTVIMATGYKIGFPFLDESVVKVEANQTDLYLHMFPPSETPPTLAVIGCVQPGGAIVPVAEMQCRLAAHVFKEEVVLPNREEMLKDISKRRHRVAGQYVESERHTIQVDFIPYMDDLASAIGCAPHLGRLLLSDPMLAFACFFGPCTPYQYRLRGPGAWSGARNAILTQMDRIIYPFSSRTHIEKKCSDRKITLWVFIALITITSCLLLLLFAVWPSFY